MIPINTNPDYFYEGIVQAKKPCLRVPAGLVIFF